jgi:hypothetical protein
MKTSSFFAVLAALCLFGGLSYQSYEYLQHGIWFSFSLISLAQMISPSLGWLTFPDTWVGLHKILGFLNAGVTIGAIFMLIAFASED